MKFFANKQINTQGGGNPKGFLLNLTKYSGCYFITLWWNVPIIA